MSDLTTWQAMADHQRERAQAAELALRELRWARHFVDEVALTLGLDANEDLDKVRERLREVGQQRVGVVRAPDGPEFGRTPECQTTRGNLTFGHRGDCQPPPCPPDARRWRLCGVVVHKIYETGPADVLTFFWQLDEIA